MSLKKKVSLSLSSWFCIPEQGMKDFEILCRASAFLIKSKNYQPTNQEEKKQPQSFRSKYHVISASHVVAPWRYPKYFPDDWLQFVNEKHTHYTLELRHDDGVFITQTELIPTSIHHASRDLVALRVEDESIVSDLLEMFDVDTPNLFEGKLSVNEVSQHLIMYITLNVLS